MQAAARPGRAMGSSPLSNEAAYASLADSISSVVLI